MKIVKNGKIYNTDTSKEVFYKAETDGTGWMYYRSAKGSFYKVQDDTMKVQPLTETEIMDGYLNTIGWEVDDEVDDEAKDLLPNLLVYIENLQEA